MRKYYCILTLVMGFVLGLSYQPLTQKIKNKFLVKVLVAPKTDQEIIKATFLHDNLVQDLYQMLKDVTDVFAKKDILYSIHSGSLLGAIRHGGMIPWDDDIDLLILQQDEPKLNKLHDTLESLGYNLVLDKDIYKISKVGNQLVYSSDGKDITYPWIDVFVMHHNKTNKLIEHANDNLLKLWPNDHFLENTFFPLKQHSFGPLTVYIPNLPTWYLENYYGTDWQDTAHIVLKHTAPGVKVKYNKKIIKKIQGEFAKPALPKYPLIDKVKYLYENR
jgi:lipopolysaccharide cholinephosphotransferase